MAGSQYVYLTGKGNWFKVIEPDDYLGTKNWKFDFYPDDKSWDTIKRMKIQKKVKENEEGKFISLARPVLKKWALKPGEKAEFDPPRLLGPDDQPWNNETIIGNGSAVTVKIEVYQTPKGAGTRLDVIRIDDLVPYEGGDVGAMPPRIAPEQSVVTYPIPFFSERGDSRFLNDEIPF